jgi:hypothetical protein
MKRQYGSTEYLAAVKRALKGFSARYQQSPSELLRNWQRFVDAALDGYPAGWYDFDNERGIRDVIQAVIDDEGVRSHPEAQEWVRRVSDVDARYRSILVPLTGKASTVPWWRAGVPCYGGDELAQDVARMYNLEMAVRP